MKKILKYIFTFMTISFIITVVCLTLVDDFVYSLNNSSTIIQDSDSLKDISTTENLKLESESTLVQYAYDNKYYIYLKDGKIYVNDTKKKELITTIEETDPICFCNLLYDKNQIVYFTHKKVGTSSKLTLRTYEISSKNKKQEEKYTVNNFSRIKEFECSPVINIIYMNIETKSGIKENNIIYRIDLFKGSSQVVSDKIISKLCMLKAKDRLYYEDNKSNIYYSGGKLSIFKEKVNLIGTDLDDNIYFISSENKNKVYKVQNNKIVDTIDLTDTDVLSYYSDNTNVYLIYPTYIINISSENPNKRLIKLSNYVTFESIKNNTVYLKTKDNTIIIRELLK
ncbi:MAG: hypothetical protein PHD15_02925 [Clostridia bacterium]|nr:hypothetical protein [Clostridia bacterium]MDD4386698.1 hypothetical protein [Clostridia bacterium]